MKVLFITNVPAPYRVDFFNELGKLCELTVLFQKKTSDERDESWSRYKFKNFKGVFLKGFSLNTDTAFCAGVIKYVRDRSFDRIICAAFTNITGIIAVQYMRLFKIPYYLECDGGYAKEGNGFRNRIKKYIIPGAEGYFSTGSECDKYYLAYGAEKNRIFRYPFTSITNSDILPSAVDFDTKKEIRKKLGITEENVILTVGQFIPRKGFDILLKAMEYFPDSFGVYFVGGTPTEDYLSIQKELNLKNAHFAGFKEKDQLAEFYMAADVFVLPTREDIWGLVVNEAMAYGLPVVTTNRCNAGLELVCNDKNGYIAEVEDVGGLADAVIRAVERKNVLGDGSLDTIHKYTIEAMANSHIEILRGNYQA